jgi:hypothetical protein
VRAQREIAVFDVGGRALFQKPLASDELRARRAADASAGELAAISPSGERVAFVHAGPDGAPRVEIWQVPR